MLTKSKKNGGAPPGFALTPGKGGNMRKSLVLALAVTLAGEFPSTPVYAAPPAICKKFHIEAAASKPLQRTELPPEAACTPRTSNGFPLPDQGCSPGAINPTLTLAVLKTKGFTTKCVRDQTTSKQDKEETYVWYEIEKPKHNSGKTQTCELDHIISLQLGGADTLENLWPQCGPDHTRLNARYFKQKDLVENYLAREVKAGHIELATAQRGIAEDWTQFLDDARKAVRSK